MFISKSDSLPRNPWIEGSNPSGNYTSFSVSCRSNPFSSKNCSFCTLNLPKLYGLFVFFRFFGVYHYQQFQLMLKKR